MRTELRTEQLAATPGSSIVIELDVANTADVIDGVTVVVDGLDPAWIHLPVPVLSLFPGDSATFRVRVELPRNCPAGEYLVGLRVVSVVDPARSTTHETWLAVAPMPAASLRLRPSLIVGGSRATFDAVIDNLGNCACEFTVSALDETRALACETTPALIEVPVAAVAAAVVHARGPRPWFAQAVSRSIVVTAVARSNELLPATDGADPPLELREVATFTSKPRIPRGVLTAAILLGIVGLWATIFLLVAGLLGDRREPAKALASNFTTGATDVDLTEVAGALAGRVTASTTGEGIPNVTVEAYRVRPDGSTEARASAATDETGTYTLAGLLPGNFTLRFSAPGYGEVWYPAAAGPELAEAVSVEPVEERGGLDVVLTGQSGVLIGDVGVPTTDGVAPVYTVTLTRIPPPTPPGAPPAPPPEPIVVETTGPLAVEGLATPATYAVRIESPGFAPRELEAEVGGGETTVLNSVQLPAARGSISGRVTDASGTPLGGIAVVLRAGELERTTTTPTAGNIGTFVIDGLETPRTYVLTFTRPGYSSQTVALDLGAGEARTGVTATLTGGTGTVTGTARAVDGTPLGGVAVTVARGTRVAKTSTLTTGAAGAYTVADLPTPGTYTVTFSRPGYVSETRDVSFSGPGTVAGVDAVLRTSTGTVSGTVTVGGAPAAVKVELSDGAAVRTSASASIPTGAYVFTNVAPGTYTLTFSSPTTVTSAVLVSVVAGEDVRRDVALASR